MGNKFKHTSLGNKIDQKIKSTRFGMLCRRGAQKMQVFPRLLWVFSIIENSIIPISLYMLWKTDGIHKSYQVSIEKLKQKEKELNEKNNLSQELKTKEAESDKKLIEHENVLKEKERIISQYENEKLLLAQKIKDLESEICSVRDSNTIEIQKYIYEIAKLKQESTENENKLKDLDEILETKEIEINNGCAENKAILEEKAQYENEKLLLAQKIKDLESEIYSVKDSNTIEIQKYIDEIAKLKQESTENENKLKDLDEQLNAKETEIKNTLLDHTNALKEKEIEISLLEKKITELQSQISSVVKDDRIENEKSIKSKKTLETCRRLLSPKICLLKNKKKNKESDDTKEPIVAKDEKYKSNEFLEEEKKVLNQHEESILKKLGSDENYEHDTFWTETKEDE